MRVLFLLTACTAMGAPMVQWNKIPLSFEPNTGQAPAEVRYLARGSSYTLYLAGGETVLAGKNAIPLRTRLAGANPAPQVSGEDRQISTTNYFLGNDAGKWRTSVPNYDRVRYRGIYPGIDLVYYGHEGRLEYDWIVSPGADPRRIRMVFGAGKLRIDAEGDLVVRLGTGEYRHRKPAVYQQDGGKRSEIAGAWVLHGREASFRIGAYDRGRELIIDPPLIYSTYNGGNGLDAAYAVAVDKAGNTYVTGSAGSTNFPTASPFQGTLRGATDAFVTKINATGTARLYSTFLGGGGPDVGNGIAVDSAGNAYVTGNAGSFDFPMMGAIQGTWGGSGDAFLTKLNATGSALVYSTYLGGAAIDYATAVALDPAGNAYIVGVTFSTNFPTVNPFQATKGSQQDAFVAKINPGGTAWVYATYLGGNDVDEGYAIAADGAGNAYVTGYTASTNFPLQSAFRGSNAASVDAFVTKLNPAGSALVYSTYLGGSSTDYGTGIAVDSAGNAYVTGLVDSKDFPVVNAMQGALAGPDDVFITKFNAAGSALVYSTYLGGASVDDAYALAIDSAGNAYVTGRTNSSDFPLTNALQGTRFAFDMFIAELNAAGSTRLFSTFWGGTGNEAGRGIAVDRRGNIHIAGDTTSADFPVLHAIQATNGGGAVSQDSIVMLLGNSPWPAPIKDVALQFPDGSMGVWYLGGTGRQLPISGFAFLAGPSSGISLVNIADLNGDGVPDLILRFSDGSMGVWYYGGPQGTSITSFAFISGPIAGWMPAGLADLNGDGHLDMVIQNTDHSIGVWYLGGASGNQIQGFAPISGPIAGWRLAGMADLDNDGHPDAVIQYTDNSVGVWYLGGAQGTQIQAFALIAGPSSWRVTGLADLDGDGIPDLTIRNTDGTLGVWYLGGAFGNQITGFTPITTPGNTTWTELTSH